MIGTTSVRTVESGGRSGRVREGLTGRGLHLDSGTSDQLFHVMSAKYSVLLPTYNESENLPIIIWLIDKSFTER